MKADKALIDNILDMRQQLAKLEAQAGMGKIESPRGVAHLEPVDKKPAKKDGPFYVCEHSIYDAHNAITLDVGQVIQTECVKWVKRMGSMLSEDSNRLPPKYDPAHVLVLTMCIEDRPKDVVVETEDPVAEEGEEDEQAGRRFSRRG